MEEDLANFYKQKIKKNQSQVPQCSCNKHGRMEWKEKMNDQLRNNKRGLVNEMVEN